MYLIRLQGLGAAVHCSSSLIRKKISNMSGSENVNNDRNYILQIGYCILRQKTSLLCSINIVPLYKRLLGKKEKLCILKQCW